MAKKSTTKDHSSGQVVGPGQDVNVPGYQSTQQLDRGQIEQATQKGVSDLLSGKSSSMPTELVEEMKRELATGARQRAVGAKERVDTDAIKRGLFRSGIAARGAREVELSTEAEISKGEREISIKKLVADHQDKMEGLKMSQQWLDSLRNYELGKERNQIAREQIAATLSIGYAQIEAQKEAARMQAGAARAALQLGQQQLDFEKQKYNDSWMKHPGTGEMIPPSVYDRQVSGLGNFFP